MKDLNEKLAQVQTKLKAKKSSYNSFGKYYFRKAEDILEATKPFLVELGITVTIKESIVMTDPVPILETTAIFSDGVDQITATAVVGVDLSQKGMQTSQQFGAASSYGKKYALGNLFLIDDTADSDSTNKHGKDAPAPKQKVEKTELKGNDLEKAKAYIQGGGNIEAIKQKYKLSSEIESELTKL
jgi:hypothetical protein|tara:strand:+ start:341 stop:895 length:555 start_codon:yes stop_codon:yes gene_type:complete